MEEKESLNSIIALRVTPEKKQELQGRAQSKGLTLSQFLFQAIEAGMESVSVKPKAESPGPEEAGGRPYSQPKAEREEEGTHEAEAREGTAASPPESEPSGSPTSEPTGEETQILIDEQFLKSFKQEIRAKWPWIDFEVVMESIYWVLARHPGADEQRKEGYVRRKFEEIGARGQR